MILYSRDFVDRHKYPQEYYVVVDLGLINLNPWEILNDERLQLKFLGLKERYPSRSVVPLAIRVDCDDVACWDTKQNKVVILHDYALTGRELRNVFNTFWDWFNQAIDDMIEMAKENIEFEK